MQVVGIALEPHQQAAVGHVGGESTGGFRVRLIPLYPVDLAIHHVLEAVGSGALRLQRIVLPAAWKREKREIGVNWMSLLGEAFAHLPGCPSS